MDEKLLFVFFCAYSLMEQLEKSFRNRCRNYAAYSLRPGSSSRTKNAKTRDSLKSYR